MGNQTSTLQDESQVYEEELVCDDDTLPTPISTFGAFFPDPATEVTDAKNADIKIWDSTHTNTTEQLYKYDTKFKFNQFSTFIRIKQMSRYSNEMFITNDFDIEKHFMLYQILRKKHFKSLLFYIGDTVLMEFPYTFDVMCEMYPNFSKRFTAINGQL